MEPKADDVIDIIHSKHGHARCRRDQLGEFKENGWKPKDEAKEEDIKAADEAHAKGKQQAVASSKAAKAARAEREEDAAEAAKAKAGKK